MAQVVANPSVTPAPAPAVSPNPGQTENSAGTAATKENGAGRPKRETHPHIVAGGKFKEVPPDASKYAELKEENFEDSAVDKFYDYQAAKLEAKAARLRKNAERFRRSGSLPDKKVAKQIFAQLDSINKMFDKLACDGVDLALCNQVRKNATLAEWTADDYNKIRVDAGLPPVGGSVTKAA